EYADPELADKLLPGHSGKSNIFDELDEKDMLGEKDAKESDAIKASEKPKTDTPVSTSSGSSTSKPLKGMEQPFTQPNFNPNGGEPSQMAMQNKAMPPQAPVGPKQDYFQNECFM